MKISIKIWHWTPRILCIFGILFISLFALDAFEENLTIWEQISGFLIHLIPSFILLGILLVAWKWEKIGGIILLALGLVFSVIVYRFNYKMNNSIWMSILIISTITLPFVVAGFLFIISHFKKKSLNKLH